MFTVFCEPCSETLTKLPRSTGLFYIVGLASWTVDGYDCQSIHLIGSIHFHDFGVKAKKEGARGGHTKKFISICFFPRVEDPPPLGVLADSRSGL